jgi:PAS domain S-box-containing protein
MATKPRFSALRLRSFIAYTAILLLMGIFAFQFYLLTNRTRQLEDERLSKEITILSFSLQQRLVQNESLFMRKMQALADTAGIDQSIRTAFDGVLADRSEIESVVRKDTSQRVKWFRTHDTLNTMYTPLPLSRSTFDLTVDSTYTGSYYIPFRSGLKYFFEYQIPLVIRNRWIGSISVLYSCERLFENVLRENPTHGYEASLLSPSGEILATTGLTNFPSLIRIGVPVKTFDQYLRLEIMSSRFDIWNPQNLGSIAAILLLGVILIVLTTLSSKSVRRLRKVESNLRMSETRFRAIFESSKDGMRLTNHDGKIVMVNSAYSDLVRIPHEKLMQTPSDEVVVSSYEHPNSEYRQQFRAGTLKMPSLQIIKRENGTEIPVEVNHTFVAMETGEKLLLSVFHDISERKKMEMELQQIQKMDSLGRLANGIANNLNNIVGIMMNAAEMIKRKAPQTLQLDEYIEIVLTQSKRGMEFAKELMLFAKPKKEDDRPVHIPSTIRNAMHVLEYSIAPSIQTNVTTNDNDAVILGEMQQIIQCVVNLALTAQERMRDGGTLTIATAIADSKNLNKRFGVPEQKEFVAISVADTGTQLSEKEKNRMFEPFYNVASQTGAGLRLSVVYGIVKTHGGHLDVVSEKEKGTTITLYLEVNKHEATEQHVDYGEVKGGAETILVIDDEESFRSIYVAELSSLGYKVLTADDGVNALETFKQQRDNISLVVSDLSMPNMNGEDLFVQLKAITPDVKVIFATGNLDRASKDEFLARGVKGLLNKPFSLDEMVATVRNVLDQR